MRQSAPVVNPLYDIYPCHEAVAAIPLVGNHCGLLIVSACFTGGVTAMTLINLEGWGGLT